MRVPQTIENKSYENEPQGILCLDIKVMSVKEAKRLRKSSMCFCHREASVVGACRDDAAVGSHQQPGVGRRPTHFCSSLPTEIFLISQCSTQTNFCYQTM